MNIVSPSNVYIEVLEPSVSVFRDGALKDVWVYMSSQSWDPHDEIQFRQFSRSVVSDSATPWTTALQASLSITNSQSLLKENRCPLSWWCHPIISSSVIPFSSCPQSLPASGSFQRSQVFTSGGQSIGVRHQKAVSFPVCTMKRPCEQAARRQPQEARKSFHQAHKSASTLILDFAGFRNVRYKSLLFKPPCLWHFVMAAEPLS